jgi:hypothetical protein
MSVNEQAQLINASKVSFLLAPCFMPFTYCFCVHYSYHGTHRVLISCISDYRSIPKGMPCHASRRPKVAFIRILGWRCGIDTG